jgi:hypothetical protein
MIGKRITDFLLVVLFAVVLSGCRKKHYSLAVEKFLDAGGTIDANGTPLQLPVFWEGHPELMQKFLLAPDSYCRKDLVLSTTKENASRSMKEELTLSAEKGESFRICQSAADALKAMKSKY